MGSVTPENLQLAIVMAKLLGKFVGFAIEAAPLILELFS